ncbi:MAG: GNAT family N-acetyltransferase [Candidatus Aenigmatarchaeota archaeon]
MDIELITSGRKKAFRVKAFHNGDFIGYGRMYIGDTRTKISAMEIVKNYRGHGIGSSIIREFERIFAEKKGSGYIFVKSTLKAADFYEKNGYWMCGAIQEGDTTVEMMTFI